MMKKLSIGLGIAILFFCLSPAIASPSITDKGGLDDIIAAFYSLFGWHVNSGNVQEIDHYLPSYVDLNTQDSNSYSVSFDTVVGQPYILYFDMSGDPDANNPDIQVQVAGQSQEYTMDLSGYTFDNLPWQTKNLGFEAVDTNTVVTFTSLDPGSDPFIDNIRLFTVAVPVPGAILLAGLGLTGVLGFRRRFRH